MERPLLTRKSFFSFLLFFALAHKVAGFEPNNAITQRVPTRVEVYGGAATLATTGAGIFLRIMGRQYDVEALLQSSMDHVVLLLSYPMRNGPFNLLTLLLLPNRNSPVRPTRIGEALIDLNFADLVPAVTEFSYYDLRIHIIGVITVMLYRMTYMWSAVSKWWVPSFLKSAISCFPLAQTGHILLDGWPLLGRNGWPLLSDVGDSFYVGSGRGAYFLLFCQQFGLYHFGINFMALFNAKLMIFHYDPIFFQHLLGTDLNTLWGKYLKVLPS